MQRITDTARSLAGGRVGASPPEAGLNAAPTGEIRPALAGATNREAASACRAPLETLAAPNLRLEEVFADGASVRDMSVTGDLGFGPEGAQKIAVLSDGTVYVAESEVEQRAGDSGFTLARQVRHAINLLRSRHVDMRRVVVVPIDLVREINRSSVSGSSASTAVDDVLDVSQMQARVLALVQDAFSRRATDIHVTVQPAQTTVEFRIDGVLRRMSPMTREEGERFCVAAYTLKADGDTNYLPDREQNARISRDSAPTLPSGLGSIRCAWSPQYGGGRYLVMRLLPMEKASLAHIDSMGYLPRQVDDIQTLWLQPEGIVLISGPTGSGKSTTLKVVLEKLYEATGGQGSIVTVEEPAEYRIHGAKQRSISNTGDFEERRQAYRNAVRALLRQDPNIIMIGEIRDHETAELALTMAGTGHLVFSTVHANSATHILSRLQGLGVKDSDLFDPEVFRGLVAQRLVRLLCPHCRMPVPQARRAGLITDRTWKLFQQNFDVQDEALFSHGPGCAYCDHTGYFGRSVIAEIIQTDRAFMDLAARDRGAAREHWLTDGGGLSMMDHAVEKIRAGMTSPDEVIRSLGSLEVRARAGATTRPDDDFMLGGLES
jgi:type II secretory ATPase GspE/PulE/Tfp pilus assembly ATPase PilB-like protein